MNKTKEMYKATHKRHQEDEWEREQEEDWDDEEDTRGR